MIWKRAALGLVVLASMLVCAGWLLPQSPEAQALRTLQAGVARIHPWVASLERWPAWSSWARARALDFSGPPSGVDASMRWSDGSAVITASLPERGVWLDIRTERGFEAKQAVLYETKGDTVEVRWIHREHLGWNPILRTIGWRRVRRVRTELERRLRELAVFLEP